MKTTFAKKNITNETRRSYPILTANELIAKLAYKVDTLPVFEISNDELVEKNMKVANGVMYVVCADGTTKPANMESFFHVGWT